MVYLDLFLGFLRVGCFAFGGAYAAIPLIREVVLDYGWLTDEALSYMIAVSESTPGPVMVNLATYVGSSQAGVLGSALATFAVVFPSFLVTILIMIVLKNILKNKYAQAVLQGVKPCIIGIIFATGIFMIVEHCFPPVQGYAVDVKAALLTLFLGAVMFGSKKFSKKKLSPIGLIIVSAVLGVLVYGI